MKVKWIVGFLASFSMGLLGRAAFGQEFPSQPIKVLVPYVAGGPTDTLARLLAPAMSEKLGQPVVVENRSSVIVGLMGLVKERPDGYTIAALGNSIATLPATMKDFNIDLTADVSPIATMAEGTMYLLASNVTPVSSMATLVAYAKANPGKLNFGSTNQDLFIRMFNSLGDLNITIVPYRGTATMQLAMVSNDVQLLFANGGTVKTLAGKARLLALGARQRESQFPGVPTISESGMPDFTYTYSYSMYGPKGVPSAVISKLYAAVRAGIDSQGYAKRVSDMDARVVLSNPEEVKRSLVDEVDYWTKAARRLGVRPQ